MYISDDMVAIAAPAIPCKRLTGTAETDLPADGVIVDDTEITAVVVQTVTIPGQWQRCPALDNTRIIDDD